jgi:hypothetical protein
MQAAVRSSPKKVQRWSIWGIRSSVRRHMLFVACAFGTGCLCSGASPRKRKQQGRESEHHVEEFLLEGLG